MVAATNTDRDLLKRAVALAAENVARGGGPFGAVVARDGVVIAEGVNRVTLANDPTAHAEVNAIRAACAALGRYDLSGCVMYASCEPCPMCLGAILWARLDTLFYAATRADAAEAGFDDAAFHREIEHPASDGKPRRVYLADADGRLPFEVWNAWENRKPY